MAVLLVIAVATPAAATVGDVDRSPRFYAGDVVTAGGLSVVAPEPGHATTAVGVRADGGASVLNASTGADGTVAVMTRGVDSGLEAASSVTPRLAMSASVAPPACSDPAYSFLTPDQARWTRPYEWGIQRSSIPGYLDVVAVRNVFTEAATTITGSRTDCDLADEVNATQQFKGWTVHGSNFTPDGVCGPDPRSLRNAVDFGHIDDALYITQSCIWSATPDRRIYAASTRFSTDYEWYVGADCADDEAFSLSALMTVMFGYNFGLGDVGEIDHGNLTMSYYTYACDSSAATLGLGDILGLRALYPGTGQ